MQLGADLSYEEQPSRIVDQQVKRLRNKDVSKVKVIWGNHSEKDATWESEADMRQKYPQLFETSGMLSLKFEDEFSLRGVECNDPKSHRKRW